jgi:ligand-binding sensor domain-containing protein
LDKEGVLWFGSNDGVFRYDGMTFTKFSTKDGLCDNQVFSIIEDKDGSLWFGTANGLCRYDRTSFHHVPIPWSDISGPWLDTVYPIVNPNQVMCMLQDRRGDIWLGTNGAGAYRYDGETFVSYLANEGQEYSEGIHWNIIHSILEDSAGNIWFTSISHAGVSRFDGETFTHYSVKDGLSDDMVRSSYQDSKGTIWFGTHGQYSNSDNQSGGLDYFDGKSFGQLSQKDGLLRGHVMSMYEDKNGLLWLGRGVGAMCVYDGTSFAPFVTEGGKTFSGVMFIFEDAEGNVWFGGKEGKLLRYDGESVDDYSRQGG